MQNRMQEIRKFTLTGYQGYYHLYVRSGSWVATNCLKIVWKNWCEDAEKQDCGEGRGPVIYS